MKNVMNIFSFSDLSTVPHFLASFTSETRQLSTVYTTSYKVSSQVSCLCTGLEISKDNNYYARKKYIKHSLQVIKYPWCVLWSNTGSLLRTSSWHNIHLQSPSLERILIPEFLMPPYNLNLQHFSSKKNWPICK